MVEASWKDLFRLRNLDKADLYINNRNFLHFQSDSGGPIVDEGKNVVGIVSFGPRLCGNFQDGAKDVMVADISTNVYAYIPWILRHVPDYKHSD